MQLLKRINWPLLILPILIFLLGFITLLSTSPDLVKTQVIFFIFGLVLYVLFAFFDYRIWAYMWKYLYIGILVLLILVFVIGNTAFGSTRWLQIGSFTIQPSEFAKLVSVIVLAARISLDKGSIRDLKKIGINLMLMFVLFVLVFIQPDLGTSVIILAVTAGIYWFAGANKIYYLITLLLAGVFSNPLWNLLRPYQKDRVLVFINPQLDVLGSGYNVIQSTIAVGSGELMGRGFGHGTQSHLKFLPVYWTDFVFAAFAEEWGFLGVILLILLFCGLLFALLFYAYKVKDSFGSLFMLGVFIILFLQFLINVGMNLGIMPVTGIPLPLVSYGGSSLITSMILLGISQSVWIHKKV